MEKEPKIKKKPKIEKKPKMKYEKPVLVDLEPKGASGQQLCEPGSVGVVPAPP